MPIYEYHCLQCGRETEVIQRFSDAPLTSCQQCAGLLEKKISISSFHLKGSGWYVTDYARKNGGSAAPEGSPTDAKTEKSDTAETKPAAKPAVESAASTVKSETKSTASGSASTGA